MTKRVGGQALFHGVMMRCGGKIAVAVREKDGSLTVTCKQTKETGRKLRKIPLLRGLSALWDSALSGIRSAKLRKGGLLRGIFGVLIYLAAALGLGWLMELIMGEMEFSSYLLENLCLCGMILAELLLLAGFLRCFPPVRKLFGYHAAEHMCINCYEQGLELTVENVRSCSRIHRRCGTNLAANAILGVLLFEIFLPPMESELLYYLADTAGVLLFFALAYEAMRYAEKHTDRCSRMIGFFGGIMQKFITTAPPDDGMIECGIAALLKGTE